MIEEKRIVLYFVNARQLRPDNVYMSALNAMWHDGYGHNPEERKKIEETLQKYLN